MAHSPRGWTGARTPSSIKRVRQTERRRAINQPRRSAAKTLVGKALTAVAANESAEDIEGLIPVQGAPGLYARDPGQRAAAA